MDSVTAAERTQADKQGKKSMSTEKKKRGATYPAEVTPKKKKDGENSPMEVEEDLDDGKDVEKSTAEEVVEEETTIKRGGNKDNEDSSVGKETNSDKEKEGNEDGEEGSGLEDVDKEASESVEEEMLFQKIMGRGKKARKKNLVQTTLDNGTNGGVNHAQLFMVTTHRKKNNLQIEDIDKAIIEITVSLNRRFGSKLVLTGVNSSDYKRHANHSSYVSRTQMDRVSIFAYQKSLDYEKLSFQTVDEQMFKMKSNNKDEKISFVVRIGGEEELGGGQFFRKWVLLKADLANKKIFIVRKDLQAIDTSSRIGGFQIVSRFPNSVLQESVCTEVQRVIIENLTEGSSIRFAEGIDVKIRVSVSYPPRAWDAAPPVKNNESKKIIIIEYETHYEQIIVNNFKVLKERLRRYIGRYAFLKLLPNFDDPDEGEERKQNYFAMCGTQATSSDALFHRRMKGLNAGALDKQLLIDTRDGGPSIRTTLRDVFLDIQLPGENRFVVLGVAEVDSDSGRYVEIAVPNGDEYLAKVETISNSPACYLMMQLYHRRNASLRSLQKVFKSVFEGWAINIALNVAVYDPDYDQITLHWGEDEDEHLDSDDEDQRLLLNTDWMKAAAATAQKSSDKGFSNGQLFDYDDYDDEGSLNTTAYANKRLGIDDEASSASVTSTGRRLSEMIVEERASSNTNNSPPPGVSEPVVGAML